MIVAISGPPGSGKTTVAEGFAKAHRFEVVSAGAAFRERAKDFGKSLETFGQYAEEHPEVDRDLDDEVLRKVERLSKAGKDIVVDGRLQPWLFRKRGIPCLAVLIDASLDVRAERVAGREGKSVRDAKKEIRERERSERARYSKVYGIDVRDPSVFDLVVDSSSKTPDAVVAIIAERVAKWAT